MTTTQNRMSSLPMAQLCGLAPRLDSPSGIAAAQSTAYHARAARQKDALELMARLPDDVRAEAMAWPLPQETEVLGRKLHYDDATYEACVGLTADLEACAIDSPACASPGHVDAYWDPFDYEGHSIVPLVDLKRSRYTATLSSLQLQAYGWALAQLCGADGYVAGIYVISDATWRWPKAPVVLADLDTLPLAAKLQAAVTNTSGEAVMGPHCTECYSRAKCPAHLLPAVAATGEEGGVYRSIAANGIDSSNAGQGVLMLDSLKTLAKRLEESLKAHVEANGPVVLGGKQWSKCGGGKPGTRLDAKSLQRDYPDLCAGYLRDYETPPAFRWSNAPKAKR